MRLRRAITTDVRVHAPAASVVAVHSAAPGSVERVGVELVAEPDAPGWWSGSFEAPAGHHYWLTVDGRGPVVDPSCRDLVRAADGWVSVVRAPWQRRVQAAPLASGPVVYEAHVKGFGGSYLGCIERLDHVVSVGANVLELMPVHPFDDSTNYWGYMPLVWGAVHRGYATDPDRAAEELAALVSAAHERDVHVWLDVVFNHLDDTVEADTSGGPGALDPTGFYRRHPNGSLHNDSGCGNDVQPRSPWARHLVIEALERYADLGVDGFRFDLASLLTRDGGGLVTRITEWAAARGVALVAEPWDMGGYQLGHGWPWPTWLQWNDRFRDDVRSFLRGEPGTVRAIRQRVQGSTDLFGPDGPTRTLNFVTAHDGLTMYDLTTSTDSRHRSWDCGPELRVQQLRNYFTMLLLAAGTPMWVMGDEFGRTQGGNDNPYDIDSELTWVDWSRAEQFDELTSYVRELVALRKRHQRVRFSFHGVGPRIDEGYDSHSIAWCADDLYVMANAWWEPLAFGLHEPGDWRVVLSTAAPTEVSTSGATLQPRSIVVWERSPATD